jgi:hypothetical protein
MSSTLFKSCFRTIYLPCVLVSLAVLLTGSSSWAQGINPYPNAITDKLIHLETAMDPPPVNVPFLDPDFGSQMVRVTDETSNFTHAGGYVRTEATGRANMWSSDTGKFYVIGEGGVALAYAFNPSTLKISSLPGATPGQALLLPLRKGGSFSFVDPDVMYGTLESSVLTISSYRFSTGVVTPVIDTTTCGVQPPLVRGPHVLSNDDVTPALDDQRLSISEGGPSFGADMFVIVYDKTLGCRWYNTQTGQIGGQWGPSGAASLPDSFLISDAAISRSGNYVRISVDRAGWYVWDLASLQVTHCPLFTDLHCAGYAGVGYNTLVQDRSLKDPMDIVKRPLDNIANAIPLVWPLPPPHYWGQNKHFTWSNVDVNDNEPICASTYYYDEDNDTITQPYQGEMICIETDAIASTVWRFAHNRASGEPGYFNTQPLGSVSRDGKFVLFTSDWHNQLGTERNGTPRSDAWIVKLD